jgi:hypothetical protein
MSKMSHIYVGPTTRWGLLANSQCSVIPRTRRGGLVTIKTADGKPWNVPEEEVVRNPK